MTDNEELERFKSEIDLREYLAAQGYVLDRKESSRASSVMRHPVTDDKVSVTRKGDHWVFYSFREGRSGTIIDMCQRLHGRRLSLGQARVHLRPFLALERRTSSSFPQLEEIGKNLAKVEAQFALARIATRHPYLENERSIPAALLEDSRFLGTVRIDARGNALFPHFDRNSNLIGFEIKNLGFTGFSPGGTKGLWLSHGTENDDRVVFCESSIDALSHAALFPNARARYVSVGGNVSPAQKEHIRWLIGLTRKSRIVAAFDADASGAKLTAMLRETVELLSCEDLRFVPDQPEGGYKDFNDQLRARAKSVSTNKRQDPSVA